MGSDSDLKTLKPAVDILKEFGIETEVCILSAHRTPIEMMEYAKNAESDNIKVIIAGAGGAAHLPGMLASLSCIPVCLLYTSPSPRDGLLSRMPSSA